MTDIHLEREHALGLPAARKIALHWANQAQTQFGMACAYQEGAADDLVSFTHSGASGTLAVTGNRFRIDVQLGFLAGMFKDRIQAKIVKNLDVLISETASVASRASVEKKTA